MRIPAPMIFGLLAGVSFAKVLTDASQLDTDYDFVIVGGGTAGCVLANRLSANREHRVLVLEAGESDVGVVDLEIPGIAPVASTNGSLIWNYTTIAQNALDQRSLAYPRGRVLGGSSSINFLLYTRGSRDDYDRFANFSGDQGWSWDSLFPYMLDAEKFVQPVNGQSSAGQIIPSDHGRYGPVLTTTNGFPMPFDDRILQTSLDSSNFSFNPDVNSGDTIGTSWVQSTSGGGVRSSAATAFLHPVLCRDNLHLLLGAQVTRLSDVGCSERPDLRDVTFVLTNDTDIKYTVRAQREVILAAGAVNTPQILLLSGVGNSTELAALNIPTVVDLPAVGKEMQDHPFLLIQYTTNSSATLDSLMRNVTALAEVLDEWQVNKTGLYSDVLNNLFNWVRLPDDSDIFQTFGDPSAGPTSAHIELLPAAYFISFLDATPDTGMYMSIGANVASPASRGSVRLASSDPLEFPLIDPGYFAEEYDVHAMVAALHATDDFFSGSPWANIDLQRFGSWANATTDAELARVARAEVTTLWHTCCTARMGKDNDITAAVTSKLQLKGALGVRVVDSSVFPYIPAAHLQAPVYAIAERAADLILDHY